MNAAEHDQQGSAVSNILDIIDLVAHANEASDKSSASPFLPELRSSHCLIHHRNHQKPLALHQQQHLQRPIEPLYPTSQHHVGHTNMSLVAKRSPPIGTREDSKLQVDRDIIFHKDVQAARSQTYKKPTVFKEMMPDAFMASCLEHGAEAEDMNHFPEIVAGFPRNRQLLSQPRKKQTLDPIKAHKNPMMQKSKCSLVGD